MLLEVAAPLIPDESYWQRRANAQFKLANVQEHGNSWKRLFFELYLRNRIETFVPRGGMSGAKDERLHALIGELKLGSPFVEKLHIRQLQPSEDSVIPNEDASKEEGYKLSKDDIFGNSKDVHPDHIDFGLILGNLTNLKDLNIYYGYMNLVQNLMFITK